MAFELVPYADIKALLGLEKAAMADYPSLGIINLRLLPSFQEETGRLFEKKEYTELSFAVNTPVRMIPLKAIPIESVSVVEITSNLSGDSTLGDTDFEITEYGIKLFGSVTNCKVSITYTGGLESVTDEISGAALYQLAYEFQSKEQIGATSFSSEGGYVNRPELGLLSETKRMLSSSLHPLKL